MLLEMGIVSLSPEKPFTYASGIKSPIYCDNRLLISFIEERRRIINCFLELIKEDRIECDVVAGTATAGIPWAAWLADHLGKPMVYVRSSSKGHGKGKKIEGEVVPNQKILVVEDLISTGSSSIKTAQVLREEGCEVSDCVAIFSYELKKALHEYDVNKINLHTITDFSTLIEVAIEDGKLSSEQESVVLSWKDNPEGWADKHGL